MNRGILFITFSSTAALLVTQACSSDESTGASDGGASSSTSTSSGNTSSGATSSGETSSSGSSGSEDTCVSGGGACVCGGNTSPCPNGGTRDPALNCEQGPQGSGTCFKTCCRGGDSGMPPDPDAAPVFEGGTDAADDG
jgi:hypothetical protein